jgi:hypothetical protein
MMLLFNWWPSALTLVFDRWTVAALACALLVFGWSIYVWKWTAVDSSPSDGVVFLREGQICYADSRRHGIVETPWRFETVLHFFLRHRVATARYIDGQIWKVGLDGKPDGVCFGRFVSKPLKPRLR